MDYFTKYEKYKNKYLELKYGQLGGGKKIKNRKFKGNDKPIMEPTNSINVSEPWFSLILLGIKTVEGRLNKNRFKEMKEGDIVEWSNNDFGPRKVVTKIVKKTFYKSFNEYLNSEGIENCLPGINNIKDGLAVYYKYYKKEDEVEFGVTAIKVEILN
jgi:ASC-1-like (ASCH) protein